jgi:hypothetical protein
VGPQNGGRCRQVVVSSGLIAGLTGITFNKAVSSPLVNNSRAVLRLAVYVGKFGSMVKRT